MNQPQAGSAEEPADQPVTKKPTGIAGFDDITGGGLPENRLTAVIGGPGAGKTVFAVQTLVNRLKSHGEHGIFVTFEETATRIRRNMAAFDWGSIDPDGGAGISFIDAKAPLDAIMSGAFDLSGLLAGLSEVKEETGARNIVFDGIDMLLSSLQDEQLERQELLRLDAWIRDCEMSAIVTVKSFGISDRDQLRSSFLQYITDCVIVLDSDLTNTTMSRSLRVAKYRGSGFAANPVPVVISRSGFDVVALRRTRLNYPIFTERVSTGIPRLDTLLTGGYIRGSSVLISGSPGTSKSSLSAYFLSAACDRGERSLFISFDESADQIVGNMTSIGLNLRGHVESGLLTMTSLLSGARSPEEHFAAICGLLDDHHPQCLAIDPLSSLLRAHYPFTDIISESLIDAAKSRGITIICTSLLDQVSGEQELSASHVSTIADTWLHVSYIAYEGERNRALTIVKSRGTGHSNQVRELVLNNSGIDLVDVYAAEGAVVMGSARIQRETEARRRQAEQEMSYRRARMKADRELAELKARVLAANQELEWKQQEAEFLDAAESARVEREQAAAEARLDLRRGDAAPEQSKAARGAGGAP